MSEKNDIFFSPKVQRNKRSRSSPETAANFKRKEKYKMGNGEEKVGSTSLSQLMDCFSVILDQKLAHTATKQDVAVLAASMEQLSSENVTTKNELKLQRDLCRKLENKMESMEKEGKSKNFY